MMPFSNIRFFFIGLSCCLGLSSCFQPPYNNFEPDHRTTRRVVTTTAAGAVVGAIAQGTLASTVIGTAAGAGVGLLTGIYRDSKQRIIRDLQREDIEYIQYGDTNTLIVPTDKYFMFGSPRLNEVCYVGLFNIIRLLSCHAQGPIYVAGFTDNVGSDRHKQLLSQAQAETMLSYLWANGIESCRLKAEGYGEKNPVSENALIHGSAQNRRIEIQWFTHWAEAPSMPVMDMK